MTHGESVETVWSHLTSLATWSHENGPSARYALLDTHWSGWNWRKLVKLHKYPPPFSSLSTPLIFSLFTGLQLKSNLERAWKFSKVQGDTATTPTKAPDPKIIELWTTMMDTYYLDPSQPSLFEEPTPSKFFPHVAPFLLC